MKRNDSEFIKIDKNGRIAEFLSKTTKEMLPPFVEWDRIHLENEKGCHDCDHYKKGARKIHDCDAEFNEFEAAYFRFGICFRWEPKQKSILEWIFDAILDDPIELRKKGA